MPVTGHCVLLRVVVALYYHDTIWPPWKIVAEDYCTIFSSHVMYSTVCDFLSLSYYTLLWKVL